MFVGGGGGGGEGGHGMREQVVGRVVLPCTAF
jgi:hypothetical protein